MNTVTTTSAAPWWEASRSPGLAAIGQHVQKFAGFGIETDAKGRIAASAMDRQLGGDGDIEETLLRDGWQTSPHLGADKDFNRRPRIFPRLLAATERKGWEEIERRLTDPDARAEGSRCLKCNLAVEMSPPVTQPAA